MDLPEFQPGALGAPAEWHDVMAANELPDRRDAPASNATAAACSCYRTGADYRVYDSRCPHQVTNIPHLALDGQATHLPQAPVEVRRQHRPVRREGQPPAAPVRGQGRQGPAAGVLVN
ncbi:MAG: hypothetical protein MZU91_08470 [Desulfosudis oleivorans]|nr:hypothetical protein [Desulfosudis oleivorans]